MRSRADNDFATPLRRNTSSIALEIDGRAVSVPEGTSVIRAAAEAGIHIPKLCATDSLEPFGSCRLCLVEIDGQRGFPASCTTPVRAGMKVRTESPALARLRRGVMELYISDHPLDCLTCPANGNCELQDMAGAVGLREVRYRNGDGANHLHAAKDESNPYFTFDPSKCIVCSRCVRACEEVQGTFALTIDGRGFSSVISPGQNGPFAASECVSCGACVQACPTATLMEKSVVELGQPDHSVVTTCGYCGVGCSFRAEMKGDLVARMVPNPNGQANHGHSCVKGRFAWGYTTHPDRVTRPLIRKSIDRAVARGVVARSDRIRRVGVQAHPGGARPRRRRRDHVLAMHQRGNFSRAETGARGVRQQQRRYLCARLSLADRLRTQDGVRHFGDDAGFRIGDAG